LRDCVFDDQGRLTSKPLFYCAAGFVTRNEVEWKKLDECERLNTFWAFVTRLAEERWFVAFHVEPPSEVTIAQACHDLY
jgi:hypothetical protein